MKDIGQELYEKIRAHFENKLAGDKWCQRIINEGAAASMDDVATLSRQLGYHLSQAINWNIDQSDLPDGRMYYNIAQSILEPTLRTNYELINSVADNVQQRLDADLGVRIKPQHAPFPKERVQSVIGAASEPDIPFEKAKRRLISPAENITQSFADDYMKVNADFRAGSGFETYIVRTDDGSCCPWCSKLVGKYAYPENTPKDVFRRHDNCGCRVVYEYGGMRQHVHSKRTWSDEEEAEYLRLSDEQKKAEREKRIALGDSYKGPVRLTQKQADERIREVQRRMDIKYGKVLDKSENSGIIELGSEAMFRKSKDGKIEPMPKKQLQKIVKRFKAKGGIIQFDEVTDAYLDSKHAEAITYNENTILLKQNPGRASVFEELIHTAQYRNGENDGSYESRLKCEIKAQKKLLKYSKAYKLTEPEIEQTRRALEAYENELNEYINKGG